MKGIGKTNNIEICIWKIIVAILSTIGVYATLVISAINKSSADLSGIFRAIAGISAVFSLQISSSCRNPKEIDKTNLQNKKKFITLLILYLALNIVSIVLFFVLDIASSAYSPFVLAGTLLTNTINFYALSTTLLEAKATEESSSNSHVKNKYTIMSLVGVIITFCALAVSITLMLMSK